MAYEVEFADEQWERPWPLLRPAPADGLLEASARISAPSTITWRSSPAGRRAAGGGRRHFLRMVIPATGFLTASGGAL